MDHKGSIENEKYIHSILYFCIRDCLANDNRLERFASGV